MKKQVISKNIQVKMIQFFMETSIPRMIKRVGE